MNRSILFLVFVGALGCSSYKLRTPETPPLDPLVGFAPPDAARICVVRTTVIASAVTFLTRDNGQLVGATRGPGHFCWLGEPGVHEIAVSSDDGSVNATLRAEASKTYYFKQELANHFGWVEPKIAWIDIPEAREGFGSTSYRVLEAVPKEEVLPDQPPFVRAKASPAGTEPKSER